MHAFCVSLNGSSNRKLIPLPSTRLLRASWFTGTFRRSFGGFRMFWKGCTKTTRPVAQTRPSTEVRRANLLPSYCTDLTQLSKCYRERDVFIMIEWRCIKNILILHSFNLQNLSHKMCLSLSLVASGASGSFSTNSPASPLSSVSLTSPLSPFSPVPGSHASPTKQLATEVRYYTRHYSTRTVRFTHCSVWNAIQNYNRAIK